MFPAIPSASSSAISRSRRKSSGETTTIERTWKNRIAELKHDLGADDFCMQEFFATEAAFRSILLLFNLLGEFQRASGCKTYRQPATLRAQVFLCGALLGRAGHRLVLHLSASW